MAGWGWLSGFTKINLEAELFYSYSKKLDGEVDPAGLTVLKCTFDIRLYDGTLIRLGNWNKGEGGLDPFAHFSPFSASRYFHRLHVSLILNNEVRQTSEM